VATFVGTVGTPGTGSAGTITPDVPSWSAGDLMLIAIGGKYAAATTPDTPSGWTLIRQATGGTVTTGNDAGDSFIFLYGRIMQGGDTIPAFTNSGANSTWAIAEAWTPASGALWFDAANLTQIPWVAANDTTTASPVTGSGTFSTQPVATAGAQLSSWAAFPSDTGSAMTSPGTTNGGLSGGTTTART
jgi:hypothetical protein